MTCSRVALGDGRLDGWEVVSVDLIICEGECGILMGGELGGGHKEMGDAVFWGGFECWICSFDVFVLGSFV